MRRTFKAVAALAAVVALLSLNAAPSGAQTGTVTGGTITVNLIPNIVEPLASTTGSCGNTLDIDQTNSLTAGHSSLTILGHFVYTGNPYILEVNYSSINVSSTYVSGTNPTAVYSLAATGFTVTNVMVYNSTAVDSCTKSAAKCGNIDAAFPAMTGTFTGSVTTAGTAHTLSGTASLNTIVATIAAAGCTPPFSALNGKTATIAGMTVAF